MRPNASEILEKWFQLERNWRFQLIPVGFKTRQQEVLFERLDKQIVDEELQKLQASQNRDYGRN
ncbi:MAG: hypothetical protein GX971_02075 [Firmicutes bacterium]|nr:hypothetical protein [Bacillota bacterium]